MKIIVILGQTATGKSDFAVEVARKINGLNHSKGMIDRTSRCEVLGEIISADSRQVYKGMNLGTGKITKKEMQGVPHHLLDVISPSRVFTVNDFQKLANKKIEEIIKNGKVPIICGGTGFYIDAVINGTIFPEVPPNKKLRATLAKKSPEQLFKILEKLDPARSKTIDHKNPVRLIRAIEIAKAIGKVSKLSLSPYLGEDKYEVLKIGLALPPEILKERIKTRLLARIKKGMMKEIENLHKGGVSWKRLYSFGLEYRYVALYLQSDEYKKRNDLTPSLASDWVKKLNTETWHFAKRQKTWFKRDKKITWIDPRKEKTQILKKVKNFLK